MNPQQKALFSKSFVRELFTYTGTGAAAAGVNNNIKGESSISQRHTRSSDNEDRSLPTAGYIDISTSNNMTTTSTSNNSVTTLRPSSSSYAGKITTTTTTLAMEDGEIIDPHNDNEDNNNDNNSEDNLSDYNDA